MQQSAAEKDRARTVCKKRDASELEPPVSGSQAKKPRLVFTDLQRRTLQAIFKETKRPSKEMQVTIARQLGLEPTTVGNFFMNARRRSMDKWREEPEDMDDQDLEQDDQNANIKYEVYECQDGGMTDPNGAYQDYDGGMGTLGSAG